MSQHIHRLSCSNVAQITYRNLCLFAYEYSEFWFMQSVCKVQFDTVQFYY